MTENEAKEILTLSNGMKEKLPNLQEVYSVAVKGLEELEQYRSIGAVSECREAVEKQRAKKPIDVHTEGFRYTDTYRCPSCGGNFSGTGIANYCYHCGQVLDWSDAK